MDDLFEIFLNIVRDNTDISDYEMQYVFAASLLGIFLLKGNSIISKMPALLRSVNVYADERPVNEVLFDLGKTKDKSIGQEMMSCINRDYHFDGNVLTQHVQLIIPKRTNGENLLHTVEKTTHELIHLLRLGDIKRNGSIVTVQEGVCTKEKDYSTQKKNYIHEAFEEAIVQDSAKKAVMFLKQYLSDLSDNIIIYQMRKAKSSYESIIYKAHVILLNQLQEDPRFNKEIDDTFLSLDAHRLEDYYNFIMGDDNSFRSLSIDFDLLNKSIDANNNEDAVKRVYKIKENINKFKASPRLR